MYIVSACLLGINCKYSGGNNKCEKVLDFLEDKEYIAVCPEKAGGLSVPRDPAERINDLVISNKGRDVTKEYNDGAIISFENAISFSKELGEEIEGAILKANSPSCGVGEIYDGTFSGILIEGNGVFTDKLLKYGIDVKTEKEFK